MKYYIEAYDTEDKPMLGNMDGQGVIYARAYRRTQRYKSLFELIQKTKVHYYSIVKASSRIEVERIYRVQNNVITRQ
jgi:hypothetical protein